MSCAKSGEKRGWAAKDKLAEKTWIAAAALIAKIPFELARWIANAWKPVGQEALLNVKSS